MKFQIKNRSEVVFDPRAVMQEKFWIPILGQLGDLEDGQCLILDKHDFNAEFVLDGNWTMAYFGNLIREGLKTAVASAKDISKESPWHKTNIVVKPLQGNQFALWCEEAKSGRVSPASTAESAKINPA